MALLCRFRRDSDDSAGSEKRFNAFGREPHKTGRKADNVIKHPEACVKFPPHWLMIFEELLIRCIAFGVGDVPECPRFLAHASIVLVSDALCKPKADLVATNRFASTLVATTPST